MTKETKQKLIYKSETDRTPAEKTVRNCVFMAVIMYVALLTGLFLNSQINVVNAESDLVSACLYSNINVVNDSRNDNIIEDTISEDTISEENDLSETDVVEFDMGEIQD